ncbi:MAG: hypothetical protein RLZZ293_506 [Pseudomonadota bacterium]|jgi:ATP-binding protein involved in chromosome partitioning
MTIIDTTKPVIIPHQVKHGLKRLTKIKNIIAVTSGKGGVGKSTTALNLAIACANQGLKIGILDADIYGPSLPTLLQATDYKPEISPNNCFIPLEKFNLQAMSFGFLADPKQATIWRGAIVNKALNQLLFDSEWHDLDILFIDMPPGTGDIHLTLAQQFPVTATIVITTPQDIALLDVGKSINMFQKLAIPCLGVIENMSFHQCANCGHHSNIFGTGGSDKLKQEYNLEFLGQLPLDGQICQTSDIGAPIALDIHHSTGQIYQQLANNTLAQLAKLPKDYSTKLPPIKVCSA